MTGLAFVLAIFGLVLAFELFESWQAHKREQGRRYS